VTDSLPIPRETGVLAAMENMTLGALSVSDRPFQELKSKPPFDVARVRLAYGERLRRARALTEAKVQLQGALTPHRERPPLPNLPQAGHHHPSRPRHKPDLPWLTPEPPATANRGGSGDVGVACAGPSSRPGSGITS
jgi:hypothetical protein